MSHWSDGYVVDVDYVYGYYRELNPSNARLPFLNAGYAAPKVETACELGFGQGVSIAIHTAASTTRWIGTDFHPGQVNLAKHLASQSGATVHLYDEAFAQFCSRKDLPDFDFVGLHGIWTWISDESRSVIVDFLRRKLKVGGVVYASYNAFPGWATFAPVRHLIQEHARVLGSPGAGPVGRLQAALDFVEKLADANPAFLRANPHTADRLKSLRSLAPNYVAHEYLSQDWATMHFATFGEWLRNAKLSFLCSATPKDQVASLNLSADQQAFLREIPDPSLRESARDFITNQDFRRDYWVKGPQRLSPLEHAEAVRKERIVLTTAARDVPLKVKGVLGEADMDPRVCAPVIDALADQKVKTLGEVESAVASKGVGLAQVLQAALVLSGQHHLASAQSDGDAQSCKARVSRLNTYIASRARNNADIGVLATPLTGGGIGAQRFSLMSLHAYLQGRKKPAEIALQTWETLRSQGQKVVKEGCTIESSEESLAQLTSHATQFLEKELPVLKALQAVP